MSNQASEDELRKAVRDGLSNHTGEFVNPWILRKNYSHEELTDMLDDIMAGERLFKNLQAIIRTEKLKLLNELDKSMPTVEQLTTKYGYHMPEKQYGYKLALHDIREVLTKLEAEL